MNDEMTRRRQRTIELANEAHKALLTRVYSNQVPSRAQAIKAKCLTCVNFEDYRGRIGGCTVYDCPLWHLRPYQKSSVAEATEEP
jgi:hypothetical protein